MSLLAGVLGSVIGSAVFWALLLSLSRPRLAFSKSLARGADASSLTVKVKNSMPWSAQRIEFQCLLLKSDQGELKYYPLAARGSAQPVMGGWARTSLRRRRYDMLGSSHRIWEIDLSLQVGGMSRSAILGPNDRPITSGGAIDGMLFSTERWSIRTYRRADVRDGTFERGRSLGIVSPTTG